MLPNTVFSPPARVPPKRPPRPPKRPPLRTVASLGKPDGRPVTVLCIISTIVDPPRQLVNGSLLTLISVVDPSTTAPDTTRRDLLVALFQNNPFHVPPRPLCPGDVLLLEDMQLTQYHHSNTGRLTTRGKFNQMGRLAVHSGEVTAPAPQHPSTKAFTGEVASLRRWWHESEKEARRLLVEEVENMNLTPSQLNICDRNIWKLIIRPPNGVEPDYPPPRYQPATYSTLEAITAPGQYNVECKVILVRRVSGEGRVNVDIVVTDGGVLCPALRGQADTAPSGASCPQTMVLRIPPPLLWHARFLHDDACINLRSLTVCPAEGGKLRAHLENPHAALVWFSAPKIQAAGLLRRIKKATSRCGH